MPIFFRNALLVQLDPPRVEAGNLRVVNDKIAAVGASVESQPGDDVIDCTGAVLMPGLVNSHTHLYSALAVGMPASPKVPRNFHEILKFIWWRLDRVHTLESVEMSGAVAVLAALHLRHDDAHRSPRIAQCDRRQLIGLGKRHRHGWVSRCVVL